jgi:5-methylcytosine-specific restriction endonuclease McrA
MAATQDWLCPWCEQPITPEQIQASEVNVDHIIPKCRGGPGDRWNRQLLHALCNRSGGKWKQLTEAAIQLAAEHGIELREPPKNPGWRRRVLPPPVRQYLDEMDRDI